MYTCTCESVADQIALGACDCFSNTVVKPPNYNVLIELFYEKSGISKITLDEDVITGVGQ